MTRFSTKHTGGHPSLLLAETHTSGPSLLLLHGVTRSHQDFSPLFPLVSHQARVIGLDHRGHGGSQRADRYLVVDYVSDAVRALRDVITRPVVILGHSLGAMVAAGVAAALPEQVAGVVLADPPFHGMGKRIAGTSWEALFSGLQTAAQNHTSLEPLTDAIAEIMLPLPDGGWVKMGDVRDRQALRWSAECLAQLDPDLLTPIIQGRWLEGYDLQAIAAAIRCPVRLLQADPTAGGALSDDECRLFASAAPACEIERFPGVGHLVHWVQPQRVSAAVVAMAEATREQA